MNHKPLCFVLMPFGEKPTGDGGSIDFDAVYNELIRPAIDAAGLAPIRADEEQTGGVIHKPMFERLLLCDYAVADLTTANANVFYELGVRHAVRPHSTVLIFAEGCGQLPFDVGLLRALPYRRADAGPAGMAEGRQALQAKLEAAKEGATDSPLYQLIEDYPEVDHSKTDVFRDRVRYAAAAKQQLATARKRGVAALREVAASLGPIEQIESGVLIDLFLSYRAVKAWQDMVALAEAMPRPLAASVMVQEQQGLALNRLGRGDEAEAVLTQLIARRGPSSETLGILGRVYKDRWQQATENGSPARARALLDKAIAAYCQGFEADWRDAYPGINAVTLMAIKNPPDPARHALLPVVRYAVERRIASGQPDYWDHATLLELAVLAQDEAAAQHHLGEALVAQREVWEAETTANNLGLLRAARVQRGEQPAWADALEAELRQAAVSA